MKIDLIDLLLVGEANRSIAHRLGVSNPTIFAQHAHLNRVNRRLGNPYLVFRTVIAEAVRNGEFPRQDVELPTSMVTGAVIQTIDTKILSDRLDGPLMQRAGAVAGECLHLLQG